MVIAKKETELLDNAAVRLTVTVDKDAIQQEYDGLVNEYCKTVRVKGFRPGKVPPAVLIRKFQDALIGETGERIIRKSLEEAVEQADKKPIASTVPEVDSEDRLELGKDYTYKVTYDTYPEIELGPYQGLEIEEPVVKITDEDIGRELKSLQEQNSIVVDKKEGAVEEGNIVNIDYVELDPQGQEVPETRRESFVFEVGTGYNLYKIDQDLVGVKETEEKTLAKRYPEDFEIKELAGREVSLKVKVNNIKEKQLPEVDDELAQDISDKYQTLEDLKKDIRQRLEDFARTRIREQSISQLLDKIAAATKVPLPRSMVDQELENQWRSFLSRVRSEEKTVLEQLSREGRSKADVQAEWRPAAERRILLQLVVQELAEQEKIEVPQDELEERVKRQAEAEGLPVEEARERLAGSGYLQLMGYDLRNEKLYDRLLQLSTVKKGKQTKFLDLVQGNQ